MEHSMPHYMAELVLAGRNVLMVGGGRVARRKIEGLLVCGAKVTVVAPTLDAVVAQWVARGQVAYRRESFAEGMLEESPRPLLIFAATDQAGLNREIARLSGIHGILCNSADDPGSSGFLVPAVVRRGEVAVAVGSGGRSPALSRVLKEHIDAWLEPGWGELAQVFGDWRPRVAERIPDSQTRQSFWRSTALAAADPQNSALTGDTRGWLQDRLEKQTQNNQE
ncbi:MAG: bifunctional precorrin-2 dehydrogenase/sirohydrochlorin ferrochelatase [Magnetococcales bacterium]|nr:bifunctional precorrin-2 dehydrogenase/sirohydrochlorin ferrochelatase [Magnetococcales bacterium]